MNPNRIYRQTLRRALAEIAERELANGTMGFGVDCPGCSEEADVDEVALVHEARCRECQIDLSEAAAKVLELKKACTHRWRNLREGYWCSLCRAFVDETGIAERKAILAAMSAAGFGEPEEDEDEWALSWSVGEGELTARCYEGRWEFNLDVTIRMSCPDFEALKSFANAAGKFKPVEPSPAALVSIEACTDWIRTFPKIDLDGAKA